MASGGGKSGGSAGAKDPGVFLSPAPQEKPKGLMEALSDIQQMHVMESRALGMGGIHGAAADGIPEDWFTFQSRIDYWNIGFKASLAGGLVGFFFIPLAFGVLDKNIPVFGTWSPTVLDELIVFVGAVSFHIGYGVLLASLGRFYVGAVCKSMIKNLLSGVVVGALAKGVLVFLLFHFIALYFITPLKVQEAMYWFYPAFTYDQLNATYKWILEFRPVLLKSAWFIALTNVLLIFIPMFSIGMQLYRTRNRNKEVGI